VALSPGERRKQAMAFGDALTVVAVSVFPTFASGNVLMPVKLLFLKIGR